MKPRRSSTRIPVAATVLTGLLLAGCVSSTLDVREMRPVGATGQPVPALQSQQTLAAEPVPLGAASQTGPVEGQAAPPPAGAENAVGGSVLDPAMRQQAVNEMRAKAASGSGQKQQIGPVPEAATEQLTNAEQARLSRELADRLESEKAATSDEELARKQEALRRLQQRGKQHYKQALERIENQ